MNNESCGLRPEAQAFEFVKLNDYQQKALNSLVVKLSDAVCALDISIKEPKDKNNSKGAVYSVVEKNFNRIAFLSGGRGSGKTSVLNTLIKMHGCSPEDCSKKSDGNSKDSKIVQSKIDEIKRSIVWLRPIQMDTLPKSTNLLIAVLSRINEAVDRAMKSDRCRHNHGYEADPFALNQEAQKTLSDFERLQRDIATAWEGNLAQRAAEMDSDAYAVEVLRAERNRIKIDERLTECLKSLNKHIIRGGDDNKLIFVLPIDDFDLNPERSAQLAKLIHLTSIPYLFTIILGDIDLTRNIFNQDIKKFLYAIEEERAISHAPLNNRIAHETSANIMRKLFPLSHTIKLDPMNWEDVLKFKPEKSETGKTGETVETIGSLLDKISVEINTRVHKEQYVAGIRIRTLKDFLKIKDENLVELDTENNGGHGKCKPDDWVYTVPVQFRTYPRHAQDLWRYLKQHGSKEKYRLGKEFARQFFIETAGEDKDLSLQMSQELLPAVGLDFSGDVQLKTEHMRLESLSGQGLRIYNKSDEKSTITIRLPKDWICKIRIDAQQSHQDSGRWVNISKQTASAMMLLHDLVALSKPSGIQGPSLMKKLEGPCWAYTLWPYGSSGGIDVLWHTPPWRSLWAHDLMKRCWVRVWEWLDDNRDKDFGNIPEFTAYCWIKIGTGISKDSPGIEKLIENLKPTNLSSTLDEKLKKINGLSNPKKIGTNQFSESESESEEEIEKIERTCNKLKELKKKLMCIHIKVKNLEKEALEKEKEALEKEAVDFLHTNLAKKDLSQLEINYIYYHKLPFKLLHLPSKTNENKYIPFVPSLPDEETKKEIEMNDAWFWLIKEILDLIDPEALDLIDPEVLVGSRSENLIRGWMARIACLMGPESGLPKSVVEWFVKEQKIVKYWKKPDVAHEIRRLRARSAVNFFDNGVFDELGGLYQPVSRETGARYHSDNENNFSMIAELSPYIEDIVALSQLNRKTKDEFEKKLRTVVEKNQSKNNKKKTKKHACRSK